MTFKRSLLGSMISVAVTSGVVASTAMANSYPQIDRSQLSGTQATSVQAGPIRAAQTKAAYIVQLKGAPGIQKADTIGELIPSNQLVARQGNNYNATSPNMQAYVKALQTQQNKVASDLGNLKVIHNFVHTFNGFSAVLTPTQAAAVKGHPDVANVWLDELHEPQTANTPAFLGLTGEAGQHTLGIKGEDVVVGVLDTGIWPQNQSFASDPEVSEWNYSAPPESWANSCNVGTVGTFTNPEGEVVYTDETAPADEFNCNNKLIGARYYGATFSSLYEIQFGLGEFASPRDADGHGSHTASTAAGNENVQASIGGLSAGTVSGIAPRARVAAYKVCWNSSFDDPATAGKDRGCFFGDSMAAIDQAVEDGVNVINYSIGNSNNINTPVYNAALRASQAGIFFAGSAGNSGPGAATTSNIAPWVTTVAASTYDGQSLTVGHELGVNVNGAAQPALFSVRGGITAAIPEEGFSGELALAEPALACDAITNPENLAGKIALIARGTCNFSSKILNAQNAGAVGVVVYTDAARSPIAMGGEAAGITIPGVMIENAAGIALADTLAAEANTVNVTMTNTAAASAVPQVGNVMASFSSRGQNPQTADIIKPDITAPGVQILAATSPDKLNMPGNVDGENYAYISGTSMSSPHIAGMAALLKGEHPSWSPAAIKSALMTTARQNVVKEDGSTPADPFDFGAGHADPVPARAPGLIYQANTGDYLGFLCGQNEAGLVEQFGTTCAQLTANGFATDASQLNYPSIAINGLDQSETISRTVTDVTGNGGEYTINVEAPAGIDVVVKTFDSEGNETEGDTLVVPANGTASYSLTFSKGEGVDVQQWLFGAITLNDGTHNVRSPIAIYAVPTVNIKVPELVTLDLNRGRGSFPVQMQYTGRTSLDYAGLVLPWGNTKTVQQDEDRSFTFLEDSNAVYGYNLPAAKVLRFSLRDSMVNVENADLDLYIHYRSPTGWVQVGQSFNAGSNEDVILADQPAGLYAISVHGYNLQGQTEAEFTALHWAAEVAESNTRIRSSSRAIDGRFNNVRVYTRGLNPNGLYMGGVTFYDADGNKQGTTVLQVLP